MKAVPIEDLIDSRKYVIKKNPWATMGKGIKATPHSRAILAKTPKWCKGRQGPSARPNAVAGANKVFAYCADKLNGIHPKIRADIVGFYMEYVGDKVEEGNDITTALLNNALLHALKKVAPVYGVPAPGSIAEIDSTIEALKEKSKDLASVKTVTRKVRRSKGTGKRYSKFVGISLFPGGGAGT